MLNIKQPRCKNGTGPRASIASVASYSSLLTGRQRVNLFEIIFTFYLMSTVFNLKLKEEYEYKNSSFIEFVEINNRLFCREEKKIKKFSNHCYKQVKRTPISIYI